MISHSLLWQPYNLTLSENHITDTSAICFSGGFKKWKSWWYDCELFSLTFIFCLYFLESDIWAKLGAKLPTLSYQTQHFCGGDPFQVHSARAQKSDRSEPCPISSLILSSSCFLCTDALALVSLWGIIYIYAFSRHFYPKWLTVHSGYTFFQYVCSLGIEPTTFCAANAMLYHWATGTPSAPGLPQA